MKNTFRLTAAILALGFMLSTMSCKDDDDGVNESFMQVLDLPTTVSIDNLGTYAVTINLTSNKGLTSLQITKNDVQLGEIVDFDNEKSVDYDFAYTATEGDSDQYIVFAFIIQDIDDITRTGSLVMSVGDIPE